MKLFNFFKKKEKEEKYDKKTVKAVLNDVAIELAYASHTNEIDSLHMRVLRRVAKKYEVNYYGRLSKRKIQH